MEPCFSNYNNNNVFGTFLHTFTVKKKSLFFFSGGTCMSYTGKVCQGSLTTTLGSYRNTPRFIDNRFGQLGTETFLQIGTNIINVFVKNNRKCRYIMYNMFCQYTLQPCYPDNTVVKPYSETARNHLIKLLVL